MTTPSPEAPDDLSNKPGERLGAALGILIIVVVAIVAGCVLVIVAFAAIRTTIFVIQEWALASEALWGVVAGNIVGLGGWAAAAVAVFSVRVLARTNATRAREAVNNDFRDFMQWALKNVNQDDDQVSQFFAFSVIQEFAENPPENLDDKNRKLATKVHNDVIQLLMANAHLDRQEDLGNGVDAEGKSAHTGDTPGREEGDQ